MAILVLGIQTVPAPASHADGMRRMSRSELRDRIRGGWAGQMIGVAYGAATEFQSNGAIGEWKLEWDSAMIRNALEQDDLYVEMTFARVLDAKGPGATTADFARAFRDSKYPLWHANAAARRLLVQGLTAPSTGDPRYNLHAQDIDFQIEADFIGLMCPGLPRASNRLCQRVGSIMNSGEGLHGGMFIDGMIAEAYFETDLRRIVEAGLACLPPRSPYALLIADVLRWTRETPGDWRAVWRRIEDRWDHEDPCPDGFLRPFNIDAKLNGAYVALGLLCGEGDFLRTMEIATRCGQDSDCNPSSAAGVLGVRNGYEGIPEVLKAGLPAIAGRRFLYTEYSFDDIVLSTETRALAMIRREGGEVAEAEVRVPRQRPRPPAFRPWTPGSPALRVGVSDRAWTWDAGWVGGTEGRESERTGDTAVFTFEGVGVAILGLMDESGGRADVYLDGRRVGVAEARGAPGTFDNCVWHRTGLMSGRHVLRLRVSSKDGEERSGRRIRITEALVYRGESGSARGTKRDVR